MSSCRMSRPLAPAAVPSCSSDQYDRDKPGHLPGTAGSDESALKDHDWGFNYLPLAGEYSICVNGRVRIINPIDCGVRAMGLSSQMFKEQKKQQ